MSSSNQRTFDLPIGAFSTQPDRAPPPPGAAPRGTLLAEAPASFGHRARRSVLATPHLLHEFRATNRISEAQMLDILAARLGTERVSLSLLPADPAADPGLDPAFCLRHQLVPWRRDSRGLVVATSSPETATGLGALMPAHIGPCRPVLALRDEVQGSVAARHRAALTARMSARPKAAHSCRGWQAANYRRGTLFGIVALLAVMALLLFPRTVFAALAGWAAFTLIVASTLKLAAATAHLLHRQPPAPLAPQPELSELPTFSILVPLYRERHIAERLVRRLERLEYPRGRLDIVLVLEESDTTTARAVASASLPPWMRVLTVPDGAPRTKPRAMNYALDFCNGDILGIYDAEDAPAPDQLFRIARRFASAPDDLACLQGVLDYYNPRQNWLARCFTVEYATWFRLVLPGMARLGFAVPLGGTTLFVRRQVLEAVGAWDAHNVTEDADLGFRLARHGYRTEVIGTTTGEEANCHAIPWIRQRSRWLKGYLVTYAVHMGRPARLLRDLGPWRFLGFQAHFITALSQFILAPLLWTFWLIPLGLPHPLQGHVPAGLLSLCAGLFLLAECVNMALGAIATRGPRHRHLWPWVPTLHLYYPIGCAAAYKALYELLVCPFYWDKTAHGISPPQEPQAPPAPSVTVPEPGERAA